MSDYLYADSVDKAASALPSNRLEAILLIASVDENKAVQLISQSNLLAHLPNNETQHKLTVRINSLISAQNALGYQLAQLWLQQSSTIWNNHLVNHASTWTTQILNLLSSPAKLVQRKNADILLASAMELAVTHIFSENSSTRQEFFRQVVTPNLPKFVQAMAQLLDFTITNTDEASTESVLRVALNSTSRLMQVHPAQFRSASSKITELVSGYLYRSEELPLQLSMYTAAARLLTALHLTGALASKGSEASGGTERITQAQLWQMTLASHLRHTAEAWRHAVSSYQDAMDPSTSAKSTAKSDGASLKPFSKDPISATKMAHARLALFLGFGGRPGLIQLHLKTATPRPVPIPVGTLLALATDMLRIDYTSRQKVTSEAKLCAMQATYLPILHTSALTLIGQVAVTAPKAFALQASSVLSEVCRVVETNDTVSASASGNGSVRLRMAAFATLALLVGQNGVGVHLDPAARTTLRLARISAGQIANAVLQPASSMQSSEETSVSQTSLTSRKSKKARLYESDAVFGSSNANPKDFVHSLGPEEIESTVSALEVSAAAFPSLVTGLSAQHHDLAQLTLNITIALIEIIFDSLPSSHTSTDYAKESGASATPTVDTLLISALSTIAVLCAEAPSSILALGVPRILPLLTRMTQVAGNGGDTAIRNATIAAIAKVDAATKGKFVPVARGVVGFGPQGSDDFDSVPENARMPSQTILLNPDHASAQKDISAVLGVRKAARDEDDEDEDDQGQTLQDASKGSEVSAIPASPPRGPPLPASTETATSFSPDPVKPLHRPITPRIGSPTASPSSNIAARDSIRHSPLSRHTSPSSGRDGPSALGSSLLGGQLSSTSVAGSTSTATAQQVFGSISTVSSPVVTATTKPVSSVLQTQDEIKFDDDNNDEDDDDEEMPEIDLGSSDDESDNSRSQD